MKRNSLNNASLNPDKDSSLSGFSVLFFILIAVVLIINVLFQQQTNSAFIQRSWGINNFAYYAVWLQVLVFMVLIVVAIPYVNAKITGLIERVANRLDSIKVQKMSKKLWFVLIAIALTIVLYIFKIKYAFLGDRDIRVDQSVKGIYVTDEYLTMYLLHYLNLFMVKVFHFTPHRTFVFHSIAAGFVYFFTTLLIADQLFVKTRNKIIFFLFCISISSIMVFSGYVEIYAFPAASVSLYIYAGILYLKNKIKLIIPLLLLLFAVALHLEQVSLIPSFVFMVVSRAKFANKFISLPILLLLALIAIPVIYLIYPLVHLDASTVVTLKHNTQYPTMYTLLSWVHFREFLNAEFLSGGVILFLLPVVLVVLMRRNIELDVISKFLLTACLCAIVIVFTANTMMGSADWDICSFPAISATMFIPYVFLKQLNKIYAPGKISYVLITVLLFNTANCWAWIGINSSDKSIKKIRDMVATDPGYYYVVFVPGEIHLTALYNVNKLEDEMNKSVKMAYDEYGSTYSRACFEYIVLQLKQYDTLGAISTLKRMITRFPTAEHGMDELAFIYEHRHMYADEYLLGMFSEQVFSRNPSEAIDKLSRSYFNHIFNFTYNYAVSINDTANARKAYEFESKLKQYP